MKRFLLPIMMLALPLMMLAQEEATLLGTWSDPELEGSFAYDNTYNEVWGLSVGGHEYAVVGTTAGTHFIDVTDPAAPFEAFFVEGAAQGGVIIHRDYHDFNGYLYAVCDEGQSTLQIIDISQLPESIEVVYDSDEAIKTAHNIYIDTAMARLYCFALSGGPQGYSAMRIYDISEPLNLQYLGEYNTFGGSGVGHVHDGYVRDNVAFLNCGGSGFAIVDFTDPQDPQTLSRITNYPFQGYNHSGWATDNGQYYYMADENHGYDIKVMDVTDPCNAEVVNTFDAEVDNPTSITHNQIVACNYLYVAYYYDGMVVFDISDPVNPEKVLYYDTSSEPNNASYKGAWGIYPFNPSGNIFVLDMQEGLFVFEGMGDNCDPTANLEPIDVSCLTPSSTFENSTSMQVEVFPIPAKDVINLKFEGISPAIESSFTLYNSAGTMVQSWDKNAATMNGNTLQLSVKPGLSPGLYFLKGNGSLNTLAEKIIIH